MPKDSSAKYNQDNKERLKKNDHEIYKSVSEKKKEKTKHNGLERYERIPEDEKQKLYNVKV